MFDTRQSQKVSRSHQKLKKFFCSVHRYVNLYRCFSPQDSSTYVQPGLLRTKLP